MRSFTFKFKSMFLVGSLILFIVALGALAIYGVFRTNAGIQTVYNDRVIPLAQLKTVSDMYAVNIVDASHKVRNGNLSWVEGEESVRTAVETIKKQWGAYTGTFLVDQERELIAQVTPLMASADQATEDLLAIIKKHDTAALDRFVIDKLYPTIDPVTAGIDALIHVQLDVAGAEYHKSQTLFSGTLWVSCSVAAFALAWATGFGSVINRGIFRDVGGEPEVIAAHVRQVAEGDLRAGQSAGTQRTTGIMAAMLDMAANLRQMFGEVTQATGTLSTASTELSAISAQMAARAMLTAETAKNVADSATVMSTHLADVEARAHETSQGITTISAATEEMTASITEISQNTDAARQTAEDAVAQAEGIKKIVSDLGSAAQDIGKITETISAISSQTNLLALNATIEAARAGDAGRGFAVVANEIKELARQTGMATEDINSKISGMQSVTNTTAHDLVALAHIIEETNGRIVSIATAIEEQSVVTRDIAEHVGRAANDVDAVSRSVSEVSKAAVSIRADIGTAHEAADDMASSSSTLKDNASELSTLAEQLQGLVGQFQV